MGVAILKRTKNLQLLVRVCVSLCFESAGGGGGVKKEGRASQSVVVKREIKKRKEIGFLGAALPPTKFVCKRARHTWRFMNARDGMGCDD